MSYPILKSPIFAHFLKLVGLGELVGMRESLLRFSSSQKIRETAKFDQKEQNSQLLAVLSEICPKNKYPKMQKSDRYDAY